MTMKAVVTGASRGLGEAIAHQLGNAGWDVLRISRTSGTELDLSDPQAVCAWIDGPELRDFLADAHKILLVNNAGTLGPAAIAGQADSNQIPATIQLNITTPILLSNAVLRLRPVGTATRIAHISSGAGRRPIPGWNIYGATKAALDQHAVTVASEGHENLQIGAIAPGVIDTAMQGIIRESASFPLREDFVRMWETGRLASPELAAKNILQLVLSREFGTPPLTRI